MANNYPFLSSRSAELHERGKAVIPDGVSRSTVIIRPHPIYVDHGDGAWVTDVDGNTEERNKTVSVFNGIPPLIDKLDDEEQEIEVLGKWLMAVADDGVAPHEFGIFVRSVSEIPRAQRAVEASGMSYKVLDVDIETTAGHVSISTMHLAKGLEFRAVAVMSCDDDVLPLQDRMESIGDDGDIEEVYETERQLLYVACTRARDYLLVSGVNPVSEFLDDLQHTF